MNPMKDYDFAKHNARQLKEFKRLEKENKKLKQQISQYEARDEQLSALAIRCGASPHGGGSVGGNAIKAIVKRLEGFQQVIDSLTTSAHEPEVEAEQTHFNVLDLLGAPDSVLEASLVEDERAKSSKIAIEPYKQYEPLWALKQRDRKSDLLQCLIGDIVEFSSEIEDAACVWNVIKAKYFDRDSGHAKPSLLNSSLEEIISEARVVEKEIALA